MGNQIDIKYSAKEVDYKLLKILSCCGLYDFSLYLAELLGGLYYRDLRTEKIRNVSYFEIKKEKIDKLIKLQNKVANELMKLEEKESKWWEKDLVLAIIKEKKFEEKMGNDYWDLLTNREVPKHLPKQLIKDKVLKKYKLKQFFKAIEDEIKKTEETLESSTLKGTPIKLRNAIASVWALAIENNEKRIDWQLISSLLRWFYNKLAFTTYGNKLKEEEDIFKESLDEKAEMGRSLEMQYSLDIELIKKHFRTYAKRYKNRITQKHTYEILYEKMSKQNKKFKASSSWLKGTPISIRKMTPPFSKLNLPIEKLISKISHPVFTGKFSLKREKIFSIEFNKKMIRFRPFSHYEDELDFPLVTFPNGEKLTQFNFEENWKKTH